MDLLSAKHVHFTGIKGMGMAALALCALDLGIKVTGSDLEEEFLTDEILKKRGITWKIGFSKENLDPKPDLLVTTGAHGGLNNPEVLAAKELSIPVMTHAEALGEFAKGKKTIAVSGVDGKTTTSAMLATILDHAGLKPSFAIGVADIPSLGTPGKYNKDGDYFIAEADEYAISAGIDNRPRFTYLNPEILVITNIKPDHPDIFPTFDDIKKVFEEFAQRVETSGGKVIRDTENILPAGFKLNIPGEFNMFNASNAYLVAKEIGIDEKIILEGLKKYVGCKRRFEKVGEINGILLYDDYAHNPSEVNATLKGTKDWFADSRIWVYFQPHTYSRTKALLTEFGEAFNDADFVGIDAIFASAREAKDENINSQMLVDEIRKHHPNPENVNYVEKEDAIKTLAENLKSGDVFITMGAGDVYKVHKKLIEKLQNA